MEQTTPYELPDDIADMIEHGNAVRAKGGEAYTDALREERVADRQGQVGAAELHEDEALVSPMPQSVKDLADRMRSDKPYRDPATKGGTVIYLANRER